MRTIPIDGENDAVRARAGIEHGSPNALYANDGNGLVVVRSYMKEGSGQPLCVNQPAATQTYRQPETEFQEEFLVEPTAGAQSRMGISEFQEFVEQPQQLEPPVYATRQYTERTEEECHRHASPSQYLQSQFQETPDREPLEFDGEIEYVYYPKHSTHYSTQIQCCSHRDGGQYQETAQDEFRNPTIRSTFRQPTMQSASPHQTVFTEDQMMRQPTMQSAIPQGTNTVDGFLGPNEESYEIPHEEFEEQEVFEQENLPPQTDFKVEGNNATYHVQASLNDERGEYFIEKAGDQQWEHTQGQGSGRNGPSEIHTEVLHDDPDAEDGLVRVTITQHCDDPEGDLEMQQLRAELEQALAEASLAKMNNPEIGRMQEALELMRLQIEAMKPPANVTQIQTTGCHQDPHHYHPHSDAYRHRHCNADPEEYNERMRQRNSSKQRRVSMPVPEKRECCDRSSPEKRDTSVGCCKAVCGDRRKSGKSTSLCFPSFCCAQRQD